jgi:hypothetical protein
MNFTWIEFASGFFHDLSDDEVESAFFSCSVVGDRLWIGG